MPRAKQILKTRKKIERDHVESLEMAIDDEDTFVRGVQATARRDRMACDESAHFRCLG